MENVNKEDINLTLTHPLPDYIMVGVEAFVLRG